MFSSSCLFDVPPFLHIFRVFSHDYCTFSQNRIFIALTTSFAPASRFIYLPISFCYPYFFYKSSFTPPPVLKKILIEQTGLHSFRLSLSISFLIPFSRSLSRSLFHSQIQKPSRTRTRTRTHEHEQERTNQQNLTKFNHK